MEITSLELTTPERVKRVLRVDRFAGETDNESEAEEDNFNDPATRLHLYSTYEDQDQVDLQRHAEQEDLDEADDEANDSSDDEVEPDFANIAPAAPMIPSLERPLQRSARNQKRPAPQHTAEVDRWEAPAARRRR